MGMAASQARYLGLTARKTNCEYEGQQINQARVALANQSANTFNQMLALSIPTAPDKTKFGKLQYSYVDGSWGESISDLAALQNDPEGYNYTATHYHYAELYTGIESKRTNPQVLMSDPADAALKMVSMGLISTDPKKQGLFFKDSVTNPAVKTSYSDYNATNQLHVNEWKKIIEQYGEQYPGLKSISPQDLRVMRDPDDGLYHFTTLQALEAAESANYIDTAKGINTAMRASQQTPIYQQADTTYDELQRMLTEIKDPKYGVYQAAGPGVTQTAFSQLVDSVTTQMANTRPAIDAVDPASNSTPTFDQLRNATEATQTLINQAEILKANANNELANAKAQQTAQQNVVDQLKVRLAAATSAVSGLNTDYNNATADYDATYRALYGDPATQGPNAPTWNPAEQIPFPATGNLQLLDPNSALSKYSVQKNIVDTWNPPGPTPGSFYKDFMQQLYGTTGTYQQPDTGSVQYNYNQRKTALDGANTTLSTQQTIHTSIVNAWTLVNTPYQNALTARNNAQAAVDNTTNLNTYYASEKSDIVAVSNTAYTAATGDTAFKTALNAVLATYSTAASPTHAERQAVIDTINSNLASLTDINVIAYATALQTEFNQVTNAANALGITQIDASTVAAQYATLPTLQTNLTTAQNALTTAQNNLFGVGGTAANPQPNSVQAYYNTSLANVNAAQTAVNTAAIALYGEQLPAGSGIPLTPANPDSASPAGQLKNLNAIMYGSDAYIPADPPIPPGMKVAYNAEVATLDTLYRQLYGDPAQYGPNAPGWTAGNAGNGTPVAGNSAFGRFNTAENNLNTLKAIDTNNNGVLDITDATTNLTDEANAVELMQKLTNQLYGHTETGTPPAITITGYGTEANPTYADPAATPQVKSEQQKLNDLNTQVKQIEDVIAAAQVYLDAAKKASDNTVNSMNKVTATESDEILANNKAMLAQAQAVYQTNPTQRLLAAINAAKADPLNTNLAKLALAESVYAQEPTNEAYQKLLQQRYEAAIDRDKAELALYNSTPMQNIINQLEAEDTAGTLAAKTYNDAAGNPTNLSITFSAYKAATYGADGIKGTADDPTDPVIIKNARKALEEAIELYNGQQSGPTADTSYIAPANSFRGSNEYVVYSGFRTKYNNLDSAVKTMEQNMVSLAGLQSVLDQAVATLSPADINAAYVAAGIALNPPDPKLGVGGNITEFYIPSSVPIAVGNNTVKAYDPNDANQEAAVTQIIKDWPDSEFAKSYQRWVDSGYGEPTIYTWFDAQAGKTYYACIEDLTASYESPMDPVFPSENQNRLTQYNAVSNRTKIEQIQKAFVDFNDQGRAETIRFEDSSQVFTLTAETVIDEDAYNAAMNQYNYDVMAYQKQIEDINAKTKIIQEQDRTLELRLRQLDTEQKALQTEMEAVKKVIEKNVESTFKTFE